MAGATVTTLVVAAYPPELDRLPAGVTARAVGIGLIDAAAGTERAIAEVRPQRLLLVGTAGALPQTGYAVGTVCVVMVSTLAVRPCEFTPGPMPVIVHADAALVAHCRERGQLPTADCVSGIGITRDTAEAERLFAQAHLEHLECFSVLRAAERAGVPATAILAIANRVGPDAHAEWLANRVAAEAAAQAALERIL
jgi:purine-nucleoside phosphorylase